MIPVADNESAAQAKYAIELALLAGTSWQLITDGLPLAILERGSYEFRVEWGKLIFAWWDEDHSQSWHVTAYEVEGARLRLRVVRKLGRETAMLTLCNRQQLHDSEQDLGLSLAQHRSHYARMLATLLQEQIQGVRVQRATTSGRRPRSQQYARLWLRLRGETILAIGVNRNEDQSEIDAILTAGLVWLAGFNERRPEKGKARRLWLCVPCGRLQTISERLTLIETSHLGARIECFEVDEKRKELTLVRPATQEELLNAHPRQLRWPHQVEAEGQWHQRLLSLAPDLIEVRQQASRDGYSYSIHGLEFARISGRGGTRVNFGVPRSPFETQSWTRSLASPGGQDPFAAGAIASLTETNLVELERLVREIITYRCAETPDRQHPFYRLRAEAWLESLLRRNIRLLDVTLDERFVYSQIPTWRADERSVIDLLAVNHEGRLVVIEIKAVEDANLPLQGLDYWFRVEQARRRGELQRRGLFPGQKLAAQPPLLYLVAPRLRFHRTFSTVARCLAPEVETYRIGLNANWRAGVQVHTRERVN
jgi:hypothetical protein